MLRALIAIVAVAALAVPAMGYGTDWDFPSGGTRDEDLHIHLILNCWIQIDWQDFNMVFNGTTDWWAMQLDHVCYASCPDDGTKFPTDPWAGADYYTLDLGLGDGRYYESGDGAVIFVRSNNVLQMDVHTNGDLLGQYNNDTIPTWFTVCLAPFQIGGVPLVGSVPTGGHPGHYLYDAGGGLFGHSDDGGANPVPGPSVPAGYDNWCDQYAFPCNPESQNWQLGPMSPYIEGTIKFLARMLRHGLEDGGDDYYTWLDVSF